MRDDRPAKRMYIVFTVLGALCIVFALFALFSLYIVWFFTDAEQTTMTQIIITTVIWVVVMILMIVGAVLMLKKRHSFYISYDYTYVSGDLRISKVMHQRKRKHLYTISENRMIKIGRYDSESYKKLKASPENKEDILTPNEEAGEGKEFFYIYTGTAVGKKILVLECRLEMISAIIRHLNKNILESEFRQNSFKNRPNAQSYGSHPAKDIKAGTSTALEVGKCPNCGGKMKEDEKGFVCPYCDTRIERS